MNPKIKAHLRKIMSDPVTRERFLAVCDLLERGILKNETQPDGWSVLLENTDNPAELAEIDRVLGPRQSTH